MDTPMDAYLVDRETCVEREALAKITIEDMLSILTKREREVMVLVALTGYKAREVADMFGVTERHIRRLKNSAQKKLRKYLADQGMKNYRQANEFFLKKF